MKTISIQVPDDFQLPNNYEVKIVERKPKFKRGDVIINDDGYIAIYEKTEYEETGYSRVYYNTSYSPHIGLYIINNINFGIGDENNCRLANEHEKNILINALKTEVINNTKNANNARKVLKETFNITVYPFIKTYQDLIDNKIIINGYYTSGGDINEYISHLAHHNNMDVAKNDKVAKSMIAMAMISQLMPYYGGFINEKEWLENTKKYVIVKISNELSKDEFFSKYHFLAFHTKEQRDNFLYYNERLVKDYLMID